MSGSEPEEDSMAEKKLKIGTRVFLQDTPDTPGEFFNKGTVIGKSRGPYEVRLDRGMEIMGEFTMTYVAKNWQVVPDLFA
jgi:hypothetical protein